MCVHPLSSEETDFPPNPSVCMRAQTPSHIWLLRPTVCSMPESSVHGISQQRQNVGVGHHFLLRGSSRPRDGDVRLLHRQVGSALLSPLVAHVVTSVATHLSVGYQAASFSPFFGRNFK